ncbi:HypC/HybG/HupF family hydrogenase formation chaperone [Propionibacterium sp.]|uniref:HypC/HybG/HupF family hydrogenase formation chaperone n=1 Tax=Propionibacterium sp. TaxID=1977903 RepID=UPI0039EB8DF4
MSIPSRITAIAGGPMPMAAIEVAGQPRQCCLAYLPEARVGDFVLVQHGFATDLMDAESAAESLKAFAELGLPVGARGPVAGN